MSNFIIWYDFNFQQLYDTGFMGLALGSHLRGGIWLVMTDNDLQDFFTKLYTPVDSRFLIPRQLSKQVVLTEVYRMGRSYPLQQNNFAVWTPEEGLVCTTESLLKRRSNFQGLVMNGLVDDVSSLFLNSAS